MGNKKINELNGIPAGYSLTGDDLVAGWHVATNKTIKIPLSLLRIFVLSGGEAIPMPPVVNGDNLIITVTEVEEGTNRVDVPALAGKQFVLRRRGAGALIPGVEYNAISSGGFILLKAGDILQNEEVFEAQIYSLAVNPGAIGSAAASALITGLVPVSVNVTLNSSHAFKLVQLRGGTGGSASSLTLTLPSLTEIPLYSIWPIETLIGNERQHIIAPQGGQRIYFNSTSYGGLYIAPGESIWLMAGSDGWYPLSVTGNFFTVGEINAKFIEGFNEVKMDGSTYLRAEHPRLWEFAQSLGSSLINDSTWLTESVALTNPDRNVPYPYRGCFSRGNGTTTFRVPDMRNSALRGLQSAGGFAGLASGTDAERVNNIPGSFQDDMFKSHSHVVKGTAIGEAGSGGLVGGTPGGPTDAIVNSDAAGGAETRMQNIGVHWYMKE